MRIYLTLGEVLERCNDWETFCDKEGYSVWSVNEGGDDVEICLSESQAKEYGILKKNDN